jgi:peptidoglycan/xylan/chitin deacetylase (PgdA/CDA1 family)
MNTIKFNTLVLHQVVPGQISNFEDITTQAFFHILNRSEKNIFSIDEVYKLHAKQDKLPICLTFDDGFLSDHDIVLPALKEREYKATFFIVQDYIGKDGYMEKDHIIELSNAGMQIGSHSKTHPNFLKIDTKAKEYELSSSKSFLEELIGQEVTTFSFPYGFIDKSSIDAVFAAGYKYCCTSKHGLCSIDSDVIPRNSINGRTKISQIYKNMRPSIATRLSWSAEDVVKSKFKNYAPEIYPKIRDFISKF